MLTMRPRAESRVCKMEFNWLRSWARGSGFSASACAAVWGAVSVSASAARCWACAAARSLAAWSAAACAACCWTKAAALAFSASACWRAASAAAFCASCCMRCASALAVSACWRACSASWRRWASAIASAPALGSRSSAAPLSAASFALAASSAFLFHGHDASFFGGFDDFAGGGYDVFLVALARVDLFRVAELLFGLSERGSGIFVGEGDVRDAYGVARFKKTERGLAVDAEDGVFNFGVGGRVDAAADELVAGVDVFDFTERGGTKDVFQHDGVTGLGDGEIRLGSDDHAQGLHLGGGFHFTIAIFQHDFAEVYRAAFKGDGPENVGQVFEGGVRGLI